MTFFGKPLSKLETLDLQTLLDDGAQENVRLEFKRDMPSRNEMLKKLSSMANTYGGYVVIGAEEDGNGNLVGIPGVDRQPSLKQTIVQWSQSGLYPPVAPEVAGPIAAPDDAQREVYVVYVAESLQAPHFIEGRRGAYTRTDEFSQRFEARLATYEEIQHLSNRRELASRRRNGLFDRAEARYRALVEQDYKADQRTVGDPGTMLYVAVVPLFPVTPLADQGAIGEFVRSERLDWRHVAFPQGQEVVTQHESVLDLHAAVGFSLLEANTWGQVFYAMEVERVEKMGVEEVEKEEHFIHLYSFLGHLQLYLQHAARFFRHFGFNGVLQLRVRMTGLRGVRFRFEAMPDYRKIASRFDDQVDVSLEVPTWEFLEDHLGSAKRLYRLIFFAVNWPETTDDASLQRLVQWGNEYNGVGW